MPTEADNFEAAVKAPRDEAVAEFHENRGLMARFQHALHVTPALVPMIVLGVSILVFGLLLGSRFLSPASMSLILEQVQIVGIVAAAQTIVILTAGIDLSVGAIMVLSSIIMGQFTFRYGLPVEISIACGLAVGGLCGAINGWLIAVLKLPPFIVTLGTWQIFAATNYIYSANETIRSAEIDEVAPLLKFFANNFRFFANEEGRGGITITYGVIFMILLILLMAYVLRQTAWGRHVYAVGDDPEAAQMAGVNVKKTLISVYAVAGVICGFAGWAMIGRNGRRGPDRRPGGQYRQHHRRCDRGHLALWGARFDRRCDLWRDHRRRVCPGPDDDGDQAAGNLFLHRRAHHPRRRRRPVDQKGVEMSEPILKGRGLVKRYGRVVALDRCDFDLYPGEILAVIGDNGAGKSTLIKAVSGAVVPDEGDVFLDGKKVQFTKPTDARDAGIETVYQTLAMSPALSIADNMFMGRELRKPGFRGQILRQLDRARMEQFAREKLNELGLMTIQNINQAVETLSGGQRQGVAVARAAAFGSKVIILDEPTAALGVKESRRVLELILDVKSRGIPIILISHNMPHVFEVADRIHIHRLGRRLCVINPKNHSMSDAVAYMTGAKVPEVELEAI
jgi:fructose transport system ATP-binding protein